MAVRRFLLLSLPHFSLLSLIFYLLIPLTSTLSHLLSPLFPSPHFSTLFHHSPRPGVCGGVDALQLGNVTVGIYLRRS